MTAPTPAVVEMMDGRWAAICCGDLSVHRYTGPVTWPGQTGARLALSAHLADEHAMSVRPDRLLCSTAVPCTACTVSLTSCDECGGWGYQVETRRHDK